MLIPFSTLLLSFRTGPSLMSTSNKCNFWSISHSHDLGVSTRSRPTVKPHAELLKQIAPVILLVTRLKP